MGWKLSLPMDEKKEFIEAWLSREFTFCDLCEEFGVSRKTGYKFLARFKAGGMAESGGTVAASPFASGHDGGRSSGADPRDARATSDRGCGDVARADSAQIAGN